MTAGLDGVQNTIEPGEPRDRDSHELPPEELKKAPNVTGSLVKALDCQERDRGLLLNGEACSGDFPRVPVGTKRKEHDALRLRLRTHEVLLYFDVRSGLQPVRGTAYF